MKYKNRTVEVGEHIVIFGDDGKNITAKYVRDEKIELTTPVFEYEGEEIRGYQCYWIPLKEAEEAKKEVDYNRRTKEFDKKRGTSGK
ncbi:hypothetical protein KAX02_08010 [candidate division WOR-3 bacterium]|nr:hypothetical protein [candidate division WOR-3 bacterium]